MAGYPYAFESAYGAGWGYSDADVAGVDDDHTTFLVWLIVFALIATAILGGLKAGGLHFVVKV